MACFLKATAGSLVRRGRTSQAEAPAVGKAFLGGRAPQTGQAGRRQLKKKTFPFIGLVDVTCETAEVIRL